MSKKGFVVILGLSVVVTYGVSIIDAVSRNNLIAGSGGIPFRFASSALFGESSTNYPMLLLDIAFWFVILWIIWKLLIKLSKK